MNQVIWFIQRREDGHIFEWSGSWWREGAWKRAMGDIFIGVSRQKLRGKYKAVKTEVRVIE